MRVLALDIGEKRVGVSVSDHTGTVAMPVTVLDATRLTADGADLKRLIEEELIEESDERPAPELDDARRRYYRLTKLGRGVLAAESQRLEDLLRVIRAKRGLAGREAES